MKHTKEKNDSPEIAKICKAISHPTRVDILKILIDKTRCNTTDIVNILPLAQSTISTHLLELRKVGFVTYENVGKNSYYSFNKQRFSDLMSLLKNQNLFYPENYIVSEFEKRQTQNKTKTFNKLKEFNYNFKKNSNESNT